MKLSDVKISTRLLSTFGIIIVIFLIVSYISISSLNTLAEQTDKLYKHPFAVTYSVAKAKQNLLTIRINMLEMLHTESEGEMSNFMYENEQIDNQNKIEFELLKERFLGTKELLVNAEQMFANYKLARENIYSYALKGDSISKIKAEELVKTIGTEKYNTAFDAINQLQISASNKAVGFHDNAEIIRTETLKYLIIIMIIALLVIIFSSIVISRSITKPLLETTAISEKIANGYLNVKFEIEGKDEISILMKSLQLIVDKFKEVISSVITSTDNFTSSSLEISSTAQQMSQGASEQASSVEQVSSSMEEMSANIQQNTENALQTDKIATKSSDEIIKGSQAVNETVVSMKTIAEKISIISEIAFQTNILALNAAVEAARAGEHGRGFAVVAAEVRKLAERSQIAAKEIGALTKSSVEVAERTGKLFLEIVPSIQNTAKLVQEISASSNEQSNGTGQISNAIQQLNQIAQQNAAASEELATSSEQMTSQAEQLQEIVSFFKIDNLVKKPKVTTVKRPTQKFTHIKPAMNFGVNLLMDEKIDNEFQQF